MYMKSNILIIVMMAFSTFGFSQEIRTLSSNNRSEAKTFGGYGGPFIQFSDVNNEWGILIGGKGGVVVNREIGVWWNWHGFGSKC